MGIFEHFNVADFSQPLPRFYIFARIAVSKPGKHDVLLRIYTLEGDFKLELPGALDAQTMSEVYDHYEATLSLAMEGFRLPRPAKYHVSFSICGRELQGPSFLVKVRTPPVQQ